MKSYLSSKVEKIASAKAGDGLFAKEKIKKYELVIDYSTGPGKFVDREEGDRLFKSGYDYLLQVDDDSFWAATNDSQLEEADAVNHSCDPNCGIHGKFQLVAMRDIEAGEEITFDYAMSESSKYQIECHCGSPDCRKLITGDDWQIKSLQEKYRGFFSDYLAGKI